MSLFCSALRARSWPMALGLSFLLHVSLVLACLGLSAPEPLRAGPDFLSIDTRAPGPKAAVCVLLEEPRRSPLAPIPPTETHPPTFSEPITIRQAEELPLASAAPRSMPSAQESAEEQEAPPGSGASQHGAGPGAVQAGGGTESTHFFQIATHGQAIVYVIDRSASMAWDGRLAEAKRELRASLERLPISARFQVIAYNRVAEPLRIGGQSGLVPATPENKRCLAALLESLEAEGSTEHLPALKRALTLGPDVIFFLTDAADLRPEQVHALTTLNQGRVIIHAIALGRPSGQSVNRSLEILAEQNRGCYRSVSLGR